MTDEQKTLRVRLKSGTAGLEMELPLEADGTLHPSLKPFQSIESLADLWDSINGQLIDGGVINPDDREPMQVLMDLLVGDPVGPRLLSALREFNRREMRIFAKRMEDYDALKAAKDNVDDDLDQYDSEARQLRRIKARMGKPAE